MESRFILNPYRQAALDRVPAPRTSEISRPEVTADHAIDCDFFSLRILTEDLKDVNLGDFSMFASRKPPKLTFKKDVRLENCLLVTDGGLQLWIHQEHQLALIRQLCNNNIGTMMSEEALAKAFEDHLLCNRNNLRVASSDLISCIKEARIPCVFLVNWGSKIKLHDRGFITLCRMANKASILNPETAADNMFHFGISFYSNPRFGPSDGRNLIILPKISKGEDRAPHVRHDAMGGLDYVTVESIYPCCLDRTEYGGVQGHIWIDGRRSTENRNEAGNIIQSVGR
jgi:hypothetical protein